MSVTDYDVWIAKNVDNPLGACACVTQEMKAAFPELRRVRGHYLCHTWGLRAHWWMETPSGEVIDPTAGQFPSRGLGEYTELAPDAEEPIGRCMNCGEHSFASKGGTPHACGQNCSTELEAYYGSLLKRPGATE